MESTAAIFRQSAGYVCRSMLTVFSPFSCLFFVSLALFPRSFFKFSLSTLFSVLAPLFVFAFSIFFLFASASLPHSFLATFPLIRSVSRVLVFLSYLFVFCLFYLWAVAILNITTCNKEARIISVSIPTQAVPQYIILFFSLISFFSFILFHFSTTNGLLKSRVCLLGTFRELFSLYSNDFMLKSSRKKLSVA